MKKTKMKLIKSLKLFLAFGILFNSVSPISVVFADELENEEVENVNKLETEPNNDNNDEVLLTTNTVNNEDTLLQKSNNEEPNNNIPDVFTVSVNDNQITVYYPDADNLTEEKFKISEDIEYLDGTTYGGVFTEIQLTDEVKEALKTGYTLNSELLAENIYDGTYTATATIGEESESSNKEIICENIGFQYELYTSDGTLIEENENYEYYVSGDTTELVVVATLSMGGIIPSDEFTLDGEDITLEELTAGVEIDRLPLSGGLYGRFDYTVPKHLEKKNTDSNEEYETSFYVLYGSYSDNAIALNEGAKNVELDKDYIFEGDTIHGIIYALDEIDETEILSIVDATYPDGDVTAMFDEGVLVLSDEKGVYATYTEVYVSEDTTIDTKFADLTAEIASGTEFELSYIVSLKDYPINGINGLIDYDEELLELVSVESEVFTGFNKDNAFLFLGEALFADDEEEQNNEDEQLSNETPNEEKTAKEFTILTFKFKAKQSGEATVTVKDAKFYNTKAPKIVYARAIYVNNQVYYESTEDAETTFTIVTSDDNTLASLTIGGKEVTLEPDKTEYELTVPNDVTEANVEAILNNTSAKILSIVAPEKLAVGENTITITVQADNGEEKEYTIKVTREEAPKEEPTYTTTSSTDTTVADDSTVIKDDTKEKDKDDDDDEEKEESKSNNKVVRMLVIGLIALSVIGLIYLIFKDDNNDNQKTSPLSRTYDDNPKKEHDNTNHKPNNNNKNNYNKKER